MISTRMPKRPARQSKPSGYLSLHFSSASHSCRYKWYNPFSCDFMTNAAEQSRNHSHLLEAHEKYQKDKDQASGAGS